MSTFPTRVPLISHQRLHPDCRVAELLFCSKLLSLRLTTFFSIRHGVDIGHVLWLSRTKLASWQASLSLEENQRPPRAKYPQRRFYPYPHLTPYCP
eukprot:4171773-Amphidinium_carterae.2